MTALHKLLDNFRQASASEREKGTYFKELIACYLRHAGYLALPVQRRVDLRTLG